LRNAINLSEPSTCSESDNSEDNLLYINSKNGGNIPNHSEIYTFDSKTAKADDFVNWFAERGHNKIKVGDGIIFLKDICNNLETLRLSYELYQNKLVHESMYYKRALGLHVPEKECAFKLFQERKSSQLYNYKTLYPIDVSGFNPDEFFVHPDPRKINEILIQNETNLNFLNVNLKSANATKIDKLTKLYNQTPTFLLNEIHLENSNKELITPAGYKMYSGKSDSQGKAYAAI
jgi:hypothetical protein